MTSTNHKVLIITALLLINSAANTITGGNISLDVVTGSDSQEYSIGIFNEVK